MNSSNLKNNGYANSGQGGEKAGEKAGERVGERVGEKSGNNISILLVEDDKDDRYLVSTMLNSDHRKNYDLSHCESLKEASIELEKEHYDVVLLDLGLHDCNGLETLSKLVNVDMSCPIVVLTGADDPELGEEAIKIGAEDYLPKKNMSTFLLSRSIAHSIERHSLLVKLRKQAEVDVLSGLANRLVLFRTLDMLIDQKDRNATSLAVAVMDLDGFKAINDNFGHHVGDQLIVEVGRRLSSQLRKTDLAARYGGDEFVLVLSNYSDRAELKKILERKLKNLLSALDALKIEGVNNKDIRFGVSMGVAEREKGFTSQELLSKADERMYKSKKGGQSKICFD